MIRVAIVEDKPDIGHGLSYVINLAEGFTCQVISNGEKALRLITPDAFDLVLMDIQLPGMSGIECTLHLKQKYPELKIMMCTVFEDDEKIYRAISAGASGYILKRTKPRMLVESLRELASGGAPITGSIAQKILVAFRQMMPDKLIESPLSEREQEVLTLLSAGYINKEVAEKLSLSVATVKSHIYSIYQKLHVNTRIEAINKFKNQPKG